MQNKLECNHNTIILVIRSTLNIHNIAWESKDICNSNRKNYYTNYMSDREEAEGDDEVISEIWNYIPEDAEDEEVSVHS